MTAPEAGEPTLADVQREFPGWLCTEGACDFYYARHLGTGVQVEGEDPLDLRDQIRVAEARRAHTEDEPGAGARGPGESS